MIPKIVILGFLGSSPSGMDTRYRYCTSFLGGLWTPVFVLYPSLPVRSSAYLLNLQLDLEHYARGKVAQNVDFYL